MGRTREGFPPASLVSELIYHWRRTWPNANVDLDAMSKLYPYIVEKWRQGLSMPEIAQTACSCNDGRTITPSPVAQTRIPKRRLALPPPVEPGVVFGAEDMRDAQPVARLKLQAEVAALRAQELEVQVQIQYKRLAVASPAAKGKIQQQISKLIERQKEAVALQQEAKRRLTELESTGKLPSSTRKREATAPKPPKQAKPAKKTKPPRKTPEPPAATVPPAAPSPAFDASAVEDDIAALFKDDQ